MSFQGAVVGTIAGLGIGVWLLAGASMFGYTQSILPMPHDNCTNYINLTDTHIPTP